MALAEALASGRFVGAAGRLLAGRVDAVNVTDNQAATVKLSPVPRTRSCVHDDIPGVEVDDATFARMEGLEGDAAKDEGVRVATELVARLREVPGVGGVHLMAPGWETEAVPRIVDAAGLSHAATAAR